VRIGIAGRLPAAVEALRRVIATRPQHRVVWSAMNGNAAVDACVREHPDLVLMDLALPEVDGVEATRLIMSAAPCAIVIMTANIGANASRVYEAMGYGALDVVVVPAAGPVETSADSARLLAKIETIRKLVGVGTPVDPRRRAYVKHVPPADLVAIGASAGGPSALAVLLSGLPRSFPGAVVIVQHVDQQFTAGMANWLNGRSLLPVRVAQEGDAPAAGAVLLAATDGHLSLNRAGLLGYSVEPAGYTYRPSIDVFFRSVSRYWRGRAVGVVLTGMGRDGAFGLKALREAGWPTIAQDERSSAVYGMPKAAAALGAAEVLPLDRIAPRLSALCGEPTALGLAT
jgi:two-component system response regulator WspF